MANWGRVEELPKNGISSEVAAKGTFRNTGLLRG